MPSKNKHKEKYIATRQVFVEKCPFPVVYIGYVRTGYISPSSFSFVQNHSDKRYYIIMAGIYEGFVLERSRYTKVKTE